MLFQTAAYFLFFAILLAAFYSLPLRAWSVRKAWLLAASYFFYACWNWKFVPLLLSLTIVDFAAAILLERAGDRFRRPALAISLAANLGFLAFFKYFNFLAGNFAGILGRPDDTFMLKIVLPLGISFHTFQSMSYVIDVCRRQQKAIRNFADYALFVAFFPQLVAGPIVRAEEFFGDLDRWRAPSAAEIHRGLFLILMGLVKKAALADQFAGVADAYFTNIHASPGALSAWSGALAFAMQIFFDFSGYTDIAIGCAALLGFHFPRNFNRPYLASGIAEFWRRWHMSLSRWLRDYLYIPLGGNRRGAWRTYLNLMITMLLGGLWHGASWKFVIWGGYHGALLSLGKMWNSIRGNRPSNALTWAARPLQIAFTFGLVTIGWVFFRAETLSNAWETIGQMFSFHGGVWLLAHRHVVFIILSFAIAVLEEKFHIFERSIRLPGYAQATAVAALLLFLEIFAVSGDTIPFIYFQF